MNQDNNKENIKDEEVEQLVEDYGMSMDNVDKVEELMEGGMEEEDAVRVVDETQEKDLQ